jgi:hypothetical protein
MDGRAHVVSEARQRQLGGARSAPDLVLSLENENRAAGFRKRDRGCETVRPRADDDGV